jgi:hypothetical protein
MFHPLDEARRQRADVDRLDSFWRSMPMDGNHAAAMLGLILAEKFLGWRPPWRRPAGPEAPAPLVLSLSRRRPARKLFHFKPLSPEAAND